MATYEKQDFLHVPLTTPGYHSFWEREIASKIKSDDIYKSALLTTLRSLFCHSPEPFNRQSPSECSFSSDEPDVSRDVIIQHEADQSADLSPSSKRVRDCNSSSRSSTNAHVNTVSERWTTDPSLVTEGEVEMAELPDPDASSSRRSGENMRPKRCKEKNCDFVAYNNNEYWAHKATVHRDVYSYVCPHRHCKFLTKYKHHMNHHQLSKHENVKRFGCDYKSCTYRCVTKSMLVSHQKSHWDHYPYQCGSCTYKSKFLNIYKKHLRDNADHKHGLALNRHGIPDPNIVIDIYGTRRGPRRSAAAAAAAAAAANDHGDNNQSFNERLARAVNVENSAYSIIIEAFQSFSLDSSILELELLRSQMTSSLPEIYDANSNPEQRVQRAGAIGINRENDISANVKALMQDMTAARLVASVIAIKNMSNARGAASLTLPQPQENESTDTPLDLRVSEAARRND